MHGGVQFQYSMDKKKTEKGREYEYLNSLKPGNPFVSLFACGALGGVQNVSNTVITGSLVKGLSTESGKVNLQLLLVSQSLPGPRVVHELPVITVKMLTLNTSELFIEGYKNFRQKNPAQKSNEKFATSLSGCLIEQI